MGFKAYNAPAMLALRVLTLVVLVASVMLLVTDSYKLSDGEKTTFKDIYAYRYVIATAAIGAAYQILQLPFAAYYAATQKRLIGGTFLPAFDFYADKVISLLLASGAGAGFAVTFELKKVLPAAFDAIIAFALASGNADIANTVPSLEEERSMFPGFFDRGYIASASLLAGCVLMAIVSVLSSINRTK